jgi:hypothetical protein
MFSEKYSSINSIKSKKRRRDDFDEICLFYSQQNETKSIFKKYSDIFYFQGFFILQKNRPIERNIEKKN